MTTRDDLYHLVDRIDPGHLDAAAAALQQYAGQEPALPASLGMGHSGRGDLSERADELLAESRFGE
jgi:prolyl oligopeptidase PreP (S9A serine peptidase family)